VEARSDPQLKPVKPGLYHARATSRRGGR
jgi:hypothetical protein